MSNGMAESSNAQKCDHVLCTICTVHMQLPRLFPTNSHVASRQSGTQTSLTPDELVTMACTSNPQIAGLGSM